MPEDWRIPSAACWSLNNAGMIRLAAVRKTAITAHHPSCTCPMGSGPMDVLDAELKVKGAENLRVIDAAAMPDLVSGNINAAVLMIAEKGAAMLRGEAPLPAEEAA